MELEMELFATEHWVTEDVARLLSDKDSLPTVQMQ
jgi:hypothetical protein